MKDNNLNYYNIKISTGTLFKITAFVAVIAAIVFMRELFFVILTSVVIASFVGTAANKINDKFGINRTLSVVFIYVITISILASIFYFFAPVLFEEVTALIPTISDYLGEAGLSVDAVSSNQGLTNIISNNSSGILEGTKDFLSGISGNFVKTITTLFGSIANVILIMVISFYLSIEKDGVTSLLEIVIPRRYEKYAVNLWQRSKRKIAYWVQGQMFLALIVGLLTFMGLSALNVKYALMLSIIAAVFELIPFGIILAAIPAVGLSFLTGGLTTATLVVVLYVVIQQMEGYIFSPLIVKKVTGVSPLLVILSVLIGVKLAGFWGLILAIPVAVTFVEVAKDIQKRKLDIETSLK
jgi:predicted PurR-regulated permease PerM